MTARRGLLSIAGSDPTAGAGIEADLLTFAALGHHGFVVATALTEQDSCGVRRVNPVTTRVLEARLRTLLDDVAIRHVKIGLLPSAEHVALVARIVQRFEMRHCVVDPIVAATSGARFLDRLAMRRLRERLLPHTTLVTPNLPEAAALLGTSVARVGKDPERAARELLATGVRAVLLKGGHASGPVATDVLVSGSGTWTVESARRRGSKADVHGTGCALSAALLAFLAAGDELPEACARAKRFVVDAIDTAQRIGAGRLRLGLIGRPA